MSSRDLKALRVVAPNLKRRLSGVTSTIIALVPLMAENGVVATGPGLPGHVPHIPVWRAAVMPRSRWRVWHARRNSEMLAGLFLRRALGRRYKLLFTSAAQRDHSGYTKWLIRRMDALIATSAQAASFLEREATVILHGVDTTRFCPPASKVAAKRALNLPEDDIFLGCFGRVRANKGTDIFVDALITLCKEDRRLRGAVLGRATADNLDFQKRLEAKIRNAGLHHRIRFLGEVPDADVANWYRALDLFIAPQRKEGFGLTPLEAMACGTPSVATRVGAFEELIVPGETGLLVAPGDLEAITAAIREALSDRERLERWGKAALARAERHFPLEREAAEIMKVYETLLARP